MDIDNDEPPVKIQKGQWSQKHKEEYGQMFHAIEKSSRGETYKMYTCCTVSSQHFSASYGVKDDMRKHVSTKNIQDSLHQRGVLQNNRVLSLVSN